ncbi:Protoheme IX farnesyltransferase [bacterium HR40]|nr:Protoheme IX farnesyltransferase [bacterium HR40]
MTAGEPLVRSTSPVGEGEAAAEAASLRDWWTLLKPNVMQLVVFTAAVGLYLAPQTLHPLLAAVTILCIAAGAGASAALNNAWDADIDAAMARTCLRPTAAGRIAPAEAGTLGVTVALVSVMVLGLATNWLAAGLLAFTIVFYAGVYTVLLKRRTPQNIVIGGLAGALPPVIGWSAATGTLDVVPLLLCAVIFLWTPAHFWALALYRRQDYGRAGVPMLPVVAGEAATRRQIVVYAAATVAASLALLLTGAFGWVYAVAAVGCGGHFLWRAIQLLGHADDRRAVRLFRSSIVYLFLLFVAMVIDRAASGSVGS